MTLKNPFIITARLMAGLKIADAYLSIDYGRRESTGRMRYQVWIDLPDGTEHAIYDMCSGCQGGDLQGGMADLLSFLGAAAESRNYHKRTGDAGEHEDLFPPAVVAWAAANEDAISMAGCEIEETPGLIDEDR